MNFLKIILASLLFLSACSGNKDLGRDIKKEVGTEFLTSDKNISAAAPSDKWWLEFNDKTLNSLIEIGLENNRDIQIASLAIITSRQVNNLNLTSLFPTGNAGIGRERFASPGFGPNGVRYDLYQATIDSAWEVDFLGKNIDRYRAGKLRSLQDVQLYKASNLRVVSEITQNYIELKRVQKQLSNLKKIAELKNMLVEISKDKEKAGTITKATIHNAEIDANSAASNLIEAQTAEKILTYRLAVLIGVMPEKINEILKSPDKKDIFDYSSGLVPVGLKSDILKRRPDVVAAEYEIDAADFEQSAQFKEFFPSFNLTTHIGGGAKGLGDVLKDGANIKDLSGRFSVPTFALGSLIAKYKISKAKTKMAILNYEKTVLNALEDTESQITRYVNALKIEDHSRHSFEASKQIFKMDQNKEIVGVISRENLINSAIATLTNENQFAEKKSNSLVSLVTLHKSIGGGFEGFEIRFEKDRVFLSEIKEEKK